MALRAWVFIYGIFSTGILITIAAAVSFDKIEANWVAFAALVVLASAAQLCEVEGTFRNTYYPHTVFFLAAAILLEPLLFIVVVIVPHLIEWIVKRLRNHNNLRAWYIQPFNIATHSIAGYAAYIVYTLSQAANNLFQTPLQVIIIGVTVLLYILINHFLVGMALYLGRGLSFSQSGLMNWESLLPESILSCLGYVMVVLWKTDPWLIFPALSTLVLMIEALRIPQLKQDAQTDVKTGLLNAKYFNKLFTAELEQALRYKRQLSLILADLDYMRNINNTFGHLAGDAVLAGIGKIIRQSIPDENTAGRFGGEEFMIVLPGVGCEDAKEIAEQLRARVEAAYFESNTQSKPIKATMSIGVATYPYDGTTVTDLTQAADVAVYHAKRTGRNRVVITSEVPPSAVAEEAASRNTQITHTSPLTNQGIASQPAVEMPQPEQLNKQYYDALTGLPNRQAWITRLNIVLSLEKYHKEELGVLLLDLKRFSTINNSLGHEAGDLVLNAFVGRLRSLFRKQDFLARIGDDEFALLIEGISGKETLYQLSQRVVAALEAPFEVGDQELYLNTGIGALLIEPSYHSCEEVMRDLTLALGQAKHHHGSKYAVFEQHRHKQVLNKYQLENEMRRAFEQGQFELHYQPKVALTTGQIEGTEALLRWKHPERGYISPGEFIPIAEQNGFISQLGLWVIEEAIRTISIWNTFPFSTSHDRSALVMNVNLSPVQFEDPNLVEEIARLVEGAGIDPAWLQLEITESVLVNQTSQTLQMLHRLKELGLKLALDDFGTGYCSLNYLKHFPLDVLKIDQSFINGLRIDNRSRTIVQTIIQLGQSFNLKVVAEGVEHSEELLYLKQAGCDLAQGYYFVRPLSAEKLTPLLRNGYFQMSDQESLSA
jgi:diguanylate cyclase (GGDEF)-like protein